VRQAQSAIQPARGFKLAGPRLPERVRSEAGSRPACERPIGGEVRTAFVLSGQAAWCNPAWRFVEVSFNLNFLNGGRLWDYAQTGAQVGSNTC